VTVLITLLALAVVLGVLIFVHEAGHFLAAKWAGIYVHRFSLGLGSPIRRLTFRRGETEYSVSWLPLGGYVKMASREEDATSALLEGGAATPVPPDRVFEAKPVWKRIVVILAGVTMNVLFAWAVYTGLAAKNGRSLDPTTTVGRVLPEVATGAAAPLAELRPGDRITAVNGEVPRSWDDIVERLISDGGALRIDLADGRHVDLHVHPAAVEDRSRIATALLPFRPAVVDSVLADRPAAQGGVQKGDTLVAINSRPIAQTYDVFEVMDTSAGHAVTLTVGRAGGRRDLQMRARAETVPDTGGKQRTVGRIGVAFHNPEYHEPVGLVEAVRLGTAATVNSAGLIVRTVQGLLTRRVATSTIGGPILIAQQAGESARMGPDRFLAFMAFISVNLAVLNLLPVPVLDGGQFVILLTEAVTRRPVPVRVRERLAMVGLVMVVLLMVLAFSNDIRRLLGG
jgi:regulator of sigma E protease